MASSLDIKKVQMIHKQAQTGVMTSALMTAIKATQAKYGSAYGAKVTGLLDNPTLRMYKAKWPYAWGGSSGGGGSTGGGSTGGDFNPGGIVDKVIGGVLLFGIFKVLMKVF